MPRRRKATLGHLLQYAAFRSVETVLRLVSVRASFRAGVCLARLAYPLCGPLRRVVQRNIRFAMGQHLSEAELEALTKTVFQRTAGNLLSSIRIPFLSDQEVRDHVTIENLDLLQEALREGKGTILLVPHMGNWELLAQARTLLEIPGEAATHYRPLNNPLMNSLIERRRKRRGVRLFAKRTSSHTLCRFLRENGVLAILADQRIPRRGALCPFFGRPTVCSPLPALLARRTGARILGLHCTTAGDDHWILSLTPVHGTDSTACAANLEAAWRSSPEDVFWFQDRWKLPRTHPLIGLTRPPFPEASAITSPIRLVPLHTSSEPPPPRPHFPFPDHLVTWEPRACDDPAEITAEEARTVDLFITDQKLPFPSCPADRLVPDPDSSS